MPGVKVSKRQGLSVPSFGFGLAVNNAAKAILS
nr:MAG TPA: hypothetical protein [Bacteriophage sp.]